MPPRDVTFGDYPTTRPEVSWSLRAIRYRRTCADWCEKCGRYRRKILGHWFGPKLEVHHCRGRGWYRPLGQETDEELMTLCEPCHDRITALSRAESIARGAMDLDGRIVNPALYGIVTREVTDGYPRKWVRFGLRRLMRELGRRW